MFKRIFIALFLITNFIFLPSCGTVLKFKYINQPTTKKVDYFVVALDGMATILFVLPGVIAFSIDYATGTLFIPDIKPIELEDTSNETIKNTLEEKGVDVSNLDEALNNSINLVALKQRTIKNSVK